MKNPSLGGGEGYKKVFLKIIVLLSAGVIFSILFFYLIGTYGPKIERYFSAKKGLEVYKQMLIEENALIESAKKDFVGGKTPEETLKMFLEALKTNSPEEVVKYYAVSERDREMEDYKKELSLNGNLDRSYNYFLKLFNSGTKTCSSDVGCGYEFNYIRTSTSTSVMNISGQDVEIVSPPGTESSTFIDLKLNPYTKVWKVVNP